MRRHYSNFLEQPLMVATRKEIRDGRWKEEREEGEILQAESSLHALLFIFLLDHSNH